MNTEIITFRFSKSEKRRQGHYFRDKIITHGLLTKSEYYEMLSTAINISSVDCHFSRMNSTNILKAIRFSVSYLNSATQQRITDLPIYTIHE